ncbi:MAG: hypothetical protein K0U68_08720 [Gammaproteobacteria bacterium]|nr:hypothetical protein [Gammaproteobacteria bacterium]
MTKLHSRFIVFALAILMLMTRYDHFGSAVSLPDASLAIFFFAGLYSIRAGGFVLLLVEAFAIDYVATQVGGVSDFCITPAYLFLIPAYAVLWLTGLYNRQLLGYSVKQVINLAGALIVATSMSFLMSNASFYLLSGYVADQNWAGFFEQLIRYYPHYLLTALLYASVILSCQFAWQTLQINHTKELQ